MDGKSTKRFSTKSRRAIPVCLVNNSLGEEPVRTQTVKESNMGSQRVLKSAAFWAGCVLSYLVFQFLVFLFYMSAGWPQGRDVFGPYPSIPGAVEVFYWLQFIAVPFLPWRLRVFVVVQFGLFVGVHALPPWRTEGSEFFQSAVIPSYVWWIFAIQFVLLSCFVSCVPWLSSIRWRDFGVNKLLAEERIDSEVPIAEGGKQSGRIEAPLTTAVSIATVLHAIALSLAIQSRMIQLRSGDLISAVILVVGLFASLTLFSRSENKRAVAFCDTTWKRAGISLLGVFGMQGLTWMLWQGGKPFGIYLGGNLGIFAASFCFLILVWSGGQIGKRAGEPEFVGKGMLIVGIIGPLALGNLGFLAKIALS